MNESRDKAGLSLILLIGCGVVAPWTLWALVPMLAVACVTGSLRLARYGASVAARPFAATILAGAVPVTIGAINGTPGWLDVGVALVAGPAAWFVASQGAGQRLLRWLPTTLSIGVILAAAVVIGLVVGFRVPLLSSLDLNPGATRSTTEIRVRSSSAQAMLSAVPMLIALAALGQSSLRRIELLLVRLGVLAGIAMILVSGRQAGVVVIALAVLMLPLVRFIVGVDAGVRISIKAAVIGVHAAAFGLVGAAMVGVDIARIPRAALTALGLANSDTELRINTSRQIRSEQQDVLLGSFLESPLWGKGAGQVVEGVVRSLEYPWRFELQYVLLLHEGGLVAFGLYAWAAIVHLRVVRRVASKVTDHRQLAILNATVIGAAAMLVANFTNPYLRSIGLQWCIFLPIIVVLAIERSRDVSNPGAEPPQDR